MPGPNFALRRAREAAGLSEQDAAYAVGVSLEHWSALERKGKHPSLALAFRISWLLGYSIPELFREVADDTSTFDADQAYIISLLK